MTFFNPSFSFQDYYFDPNDKRAPSQPPIPLPQTNAQQTPQISRKRKRFNDQNSLPSSKRRKLDTKMRCIAQSKLPSESPPSLPLASFSTPPRNPSRISFHATPKKKPKKSIRIKQTFDHLMTEQKEEFIHNERTPIYEIEEELSTLELTYRKYPLENDSFLTVKQPTEKGCGETCLLMAALSYIQKDPSQIPNFFENTTFFDSLFCCDGTSVHDLKEKIAAFSFFTPISKYYSPYSIPSSNYDEAMIIGSPSFTLEMLDDIAEIQQTTNKPIFLSIDHPTLGGHWVLIQKYQDQTFTISDPYSGKAYLVGKEELTNHFDQSIVQHIIYLK